MGGVGLLALGVLAYGFFGDDPLPEDGDLRPRLATNADAPNPLAEFCQAMQRSEPRSWQDLPEEMPGKAKEYEAELRELLDKYKGAQVLVDDLLRSDPSTWLPVDLDQNSSHVMPLGGLGRLAVYADEDLQARVILAARAADRAAAVEDALRIAGLGRKLCTMDNNIMSLSLAILVQQGGEKALRHALRDERDEAVLQRAQERLAPLDGAPTECVLALRIKYLTTLRDMENHKLSSSKYYGRVGAAPLLNPVFLRLNRTANLHGELLRPIIAGLRQGWPEAMAALKDSDDLMRRVSSPTKIIVGGNSAGLALLWTDWNHRGTDVLVQACALSALHRMSVTMLGIRRYELVHGYLPEKLQELVPRFLPDVPMDPFNKEPLVWNAKRRWLYSVGRNGVDDMSSVGTQARPERWNDTDIVMPYWWGP
jgi:hypothetical protein